MTGKYGAYLRNVSNVSSANDHWTTQPFQRVLIMKSTVRTAILMSMVTRLNQTFMMLTSLLFREMKENWTSVLVAEERFLRQKSKLQSPEATIKSVLLVRSASTRWTQQTLLMALTMKSIVSTVTRRSMERKRRQSQCRLTPLQLEVMGNSELVQGALEKCLLQRKW